ncbi:MAG TPA: ankyrin repeat domain-containing protein [Steroidobacteraceae bacterium]|jgi:ankyrin repeat protein|nr:ankyrin repeat domain-containing protein [Steroidobacteraceae bacterium]
MRQVGLQVAAFAVAGILCGAAALAADAGGHPDGSSPLEWAVFHGDIAQAKKLLAAGANVKAVNAYGVNAMQLAADASNTELIRLLLKAGADPNSPNSEGETALHLVARAGNVEAAKLLLKAGAEVDPHESFGGQTPLMWAAARRHPAMVELLADKGADVNARSAVRDYLRVATAESRAKQLDRGGFTPLMYAARENCDACVEVLLKHKVDINLPDPSGFAPMTIAMLNSNWDIAKRLIEAGADVNEWDIFGQAPLHVAIGNMNSRGNNNPLDRDHPEKATGRDIVKLLLDRGADPNQQTYYRAAGLRGFGGTGRGTTPFLEACASGDIEVVKLLLAHGANPKLATSDGQGPIIIAVGSRAGGTGNPGAARADIRPEPAAGPGTEIPPATRRGRGAPGGGAPAAAPASAASGLPAAGPADKMVRPENPTVQLINLLAQSGADVNLMAKRHFLQRTRGGSALHYAVRTGNKDVVAGLIKLGIDVNAKDEDGLTALDYAMGRGYVPFLQMPTRPRRDLADILRAAGGSVELAKTPDWPPQSPPIATVVYDAVIWPVDPVGP